MKKLLIQDRSENPVTGRQPGAVLDLLEPAPEVFKRIAFHSLVTDPLDVAARLMKGARIHTNFHSYALVEVG